MKPKSETLFHLTKTKDVLKLILKNGIEPRFCTEDVRWLNADSIKYLAYPMSCFCDIPLSRINEHIEFYGCFGIGISKEWATKNKFNPVIYAPNNGIAIDVVHYLVDSPIENIEHTSKCMSLIKIIKPLIGEMKNRAGIITEKHFYQENEWRHSPDANDLIFQGDIDENIAKSSFDPTNYSLAIKPTDIKYIIVEKDNDIPEIVDFINTKLGEHPLDDLKILQTRIVSLETLNADI